MKSEFKSLLPSHSSKTLKVLEKALWNVNKEYELKRNQFFEFDKILDYKSYSDKTPEAIYDALSISFGVDVWDAENWSAEKKKTLLSQTLSIKKFRGTAHALKLHFKAIDVEAWTIEWWQKDYSKFQKYLGDKPEEVKPGEFKVIISTRDNITEDIERRRDEFDSIVRNLSPLRSHYEILIENVLNSQVGFMSGLRLSKVVRIPVFFSTKEGDVINDGSVFNSVVTKKGLEHMAWALAEPERKLQFSLVELGSSSWNPDKEATSLKDPKEKFNISDSRPDADDKGKIYVSAAARSDKNYDVGEIGIYTNLSGEDEALFAIISTEGELLTKKVKNDTLLLSFSMSLKGIESKDFKLEVGERLNLAAQDWFLSAAQESIKTFQHIEKLEKRMADLEMKLLSMTKNIGGERE